MYVVHLDKADRNFCINMAREREAAVARSDVAPGAHTPLTGLGSHLRGCRGELAVRRLLGLPEVLPVSSSPDPSTPWLYTDDLSISVKTTEWREDRIQNLLIPTDHLARKKADLYVLCDDGPESAVTIVGAISKAELPTRGFDFPTVYGKSTIVPRRNLRSLEKYVQPVLG